MQTVPTRAAAPPTIPEEEPPPPVTAGDELLLEKARQHHEDVVQMLRESQDLVSDFHGTPRSEVERVIEIAQDPRQGIRDVTHATYWQTQRLIESLSNIYRQPETKAIVLASAILPVANALLSYVRVMMVMTTKDEYRRFVSVPFDDEEPSHPEGDETTNSDETVVEAPHGGEEPTHDTDGNGDAATGAPRPSEAEPELEPHSPSEAPTLDATRPNGEPDVLDPAEPRPLPERSASTQLFAE